MAVKPYASDPVTLAATAAIVGGAVPNLTTRVIKAATITNPTAAPVSASIYLVPASGSPGTGNAFILSRAIAAGESYPCPELINLGVNAGGSIQALGTGLTFAYSATDFV